MVILPFALVGQDGRSEMCYPEETPPSPQKRWGQEAEEEDSVSAVQES